MLEKVCQALICKKLFRKHFKEAVGINGLVAMLNNFEDKSAVAECRIAFKEPGKPPVVFTGKCQGSIVNPQGLSNFGWDPIFKPNGFDQTFAELSIETKNEISHRGNALKMIVEYFRNNHWI